MRTAVRTVEVLDPARRLSQNTINDYLNTFRKFDLFLEDDPPIRSIDHRQVEAFLAEQTVSKKTMG